jgi:ABC-type dipeptide/oligopeptide/nickel transport system permease component
LLKALGAFFVFGYALIFVFGVFALLSEWRRIHCNKTKVFLLLFAFPIFMITYLPISICALFSHVEWLPIQHKNAVNISDIETQGSAPILLTKKKTEQKQDA